MSRSGREQAVTCGPGEGKMGMKPMRGVGEGRCPDRTLGIRKSNASQPVWLEHSGLGYFFLTDSLRRGEFTKWQEGHRLERERNGDSCSEKQNRQRLELTVPQGTDHVLLMAL